MTFFSVTKVSQSLLGVRYPQSYIGLDGLYFALIVWLQGVAATWLVCRVVATTWLSCGVGVAATRLCCRVGVAVTRLCCRVDVATTRLCCRVGVATT